MCQDLLVVHQCVVKFIVSDNQVARAAHLVQTLCVCGRSDITGVRFNLNVFLGGNDLVLILHAHGVIAVPQMFKTVFDSSGFIGCAGNGLHQCAVLVKLDCYRNTGCRRIVLRDAAGHMQCVVCRIVIVIRHAVVGTEILDGLHGNRRFGIRTQRKLSGVNAVVGGIADLLVNVFRAVRNAFLLLKLDIDLIGHILGNRDGVAEGQCRGTIQLLSVLIGVKIILIVTCRPRHVFYLLLAGQDHPIGSRRNLMQVISVLIVDLCDRQTAVLIQYTGDAVIVGSGQKYKHLIAGSAGIAAAVCDVNFNGSAFRLGRCCLSIAAGCRKAHQHDRCRFNCFFRSCCLFRSCCFFCFLHFFRCRSCCLHNCRLLCLDFLPFGLLNLSFLPFGLLNLRFLLLGLLYFRILLLFTGFPGCFAVFAFFSNCFHDVLRDYFRCVLRNYFNCVFRDYICRDFYCVFRSCYRNRFENHYGLSVSCIGSCTAHCFHRADSHRSRDDANP